MHNKPVNSKSTTIPSNSVLGIDLGTTNTVMAFMGDTAHPQIIPNKDGNAKTPSVVHYPMDGSEILVGDAAFNMQLVDPTHVIVEAKRDVASDHVYFSVNGDDITAECVQESLLYYMINSVRDYFGSNNAGSFVVITTPAWYGEKERQSVRLSANKAGVSEVRFINEPTAAALAYGLNSKMGDSLVLVTDIGGGTFDASIIQFAGGEADVIATYGDKELGGKDVDALLLQLLVSEFKAVHGLDISSDTHPADMHNLRDEVIRQKHLLAARREVTMVGRVDGKTVSVPVDRARLASMAVELMNRVEQVILKVIELAQVEYKDLSVLPVGGSSRLICFREVLERMFGVDQIISGQVSPDLAVAEGACIHAARTVFDQGDTLVDEEGLAIPPPALKHTDVMSHSLGILVRRLSSSESNCSVILERNLPIPTERIKMYGSTERSQTQFEIKVLQGEEGEAENKCTPVANKTLDLPSRDPSRPSLEVKMGYDASGMVRVVVRDMISGKTEDITTNFYQNSA